MLDSFWLVGDPDAKKSEVHRVLSHLLWLETKPEKMIIFIGGLYWAEDKSKGVHLVLVVDITMSMKTDRR